MTSNMKMLLLKLSDVSMNIIEIWKIIISGLIFFI